MKTAKYVAFFERKNPEGWLPEKHYEYTKRQMIKWLKRLDNELIIKKEFRNISVYKEIPVKEELRRLN